MRDAAPIAALLSARVRFDPDQKEKQRMAAVVPAGNGRMGLQGRGIRACAGDVVMAAGRRRAIAQA
jgi:hypothetical protein